MDKIIKRDIVDDISKGFLDYSMSVITARAIPEIADGNKPIHRRILYSMAENKLFHDKPTKKAATVVGNVMASYHPHGDSSIYMAAIRMSQPWTMRYPLLEAQGNNGSIDGDQPAAMRYVELRLSPLAKYMFVDLDKSTVDTRTTFDGSTQEPVLLPAVFPNLLANGAAGIAVAMATNIPSHNLREIIEGTLLRLEGKKEEVYEAIPAPDFATGGELVNLSELPLAYRTGRGRAVLRGKYHIEEKGSNKHIVFTEIPYQMSKTDTTLKIIELSEEGVLKGITNVFDQSGKNGIRYVIEMRKSTNEDVVLEGLFKHTQLQKSIPINLTVLDNGVPKVVSLLSIIDGHIANNLNFILRASLYTRSKHLARINILEGYLKALDVIDDIVKLIKGSKSPAEARENLRKIYNFNVEQANAILNLKLQRLTALEKESIESEHSNLIKEVERLNTLIENEAERKKEFASRLIELRKSFGDNRRTTLFDIDYTFKKEKVEKPIENKKIYCAITKKHFVETMSKNKISVQKRNGTGTTITKDDELIFFSAMNTVDKVYMVTDKGYAYLVSANKLYEVCHNKPIDIGEVIEFKEKDEKIVFAFVLSNKALTGYLLLLTAGGLIKKTPIEDMLVKKNGTYVIDLQEGDRVVDYLFLMEDTDILVYTDKNIIRFNSDEIRPTARKTKGVKAIKGRPIGLEKYRDNIITVTENGYGKITKGSELSPQKRSGIGVIGHAVTEQTGTLSKVLTFTNKGNIVLYTNDKAIKIQTDDLPVLSRNTRGNRLINGGRIVGAQFEK